MSAKTDKKSRRIQRAIEETNKDQMKRMESLAEDRAVQTILLFKKFTRNQGFFRRLWYCIVVMAGDGWIRKAGIWVTRIVRA